MIEIADVTWTYPNAAAPALRHFDLRVAPGEFVVLCGASGCGKSTALRLMNGLIPHFHDNGGFTGTVTVAGLVTTDVELDEIGLRTGTVLQHPRRQFFADTVAEELAFAMENFGFPRERIRARIDERLDELAFAVPVARRLQRLSGGQQQQVAIACADAHGPGVVLLDEPSSNLSADAVDRLRTTLKALKDRGVTIVVAEHRLRYLTEPADRVVVMKDGAIDVEWSAERFRDVSDEDLAREGLRGEARTAELPVLAASGPSIAGSVPVDDVPAGALELIDVRCRLGGRRILDIDRLVFPAGTVTAIRGVNGAGKSTLSRVITGLRSAAGTIRYDGVELNRRARRRASSLVMQDVQRQLFTETVEAEIALAGLGEPDARDTSALLDDLDLAHLAGRHPLSLSGGQQQRLVVAGARVARRPIVVFDEPSSGVDRRHLASISGQIRRAAHDGAVVLLISHDDDLLAFAADRQVTLVPLADR